ncbi:N-6 DNA methylase [Bradyrhizobium diversitatis]|uniref:site-specific DNA-methyltransferase (adenine-specific) n=1 Tax=Bradyrhizobium diversitatis TaxID=2755406 RepID=A0ABS0PFL2_9BRAD|nr:N-6 DNA methylase [Bradyrhizobium diversitatis]MBH5392092.1 N-6 DNA methylase [Bradyrhizobium diversitatis]
MSSTPTLLDVLTRAGFLRDGAPVEGMITAGANLDSDSRAGRYAFLFDRTRFPLAIEGLFKAGGAPVMLFVDGGVGPLEEQAAVGWHRVAWNVGLAPLLWINVPGRVVILDSYRRPSGRLSDVVIAEFATDTPSNVSELVTACGRLAFDTGAFWSSNFARRIDRQQRIDATLLRELTAVERKLLRAGLQPLLAQKLIGRTIFSQYLIDRGLLQEVDLERRFGHAGLSDTLRSPDAAAGLFDWLRSTFNGDLFPPEVENERAHVRAEHLATLADFLDGHEAVTGQLSAFPFRFDYIPVELISSIYEQFAHSIAGDSAAAQGLHYTPVNLVDLALDQVMGDLPGSAKVLDPACGSGVFLVEAMRRLVWLRTRKEPSSRELVRDVLRNQIFGVDINAGALQVAAFSLYLAALELDPDLHQGDLGWLRFDHLIGRNLVNASFFQASGLEEHRFDVVVGNPPWTYAGAGAKAGGRPALTDVAQPRRSPDWGFLWHARQIAASGARIALLMKATPFFSKDRLATEARRLLFSSFGDVKLINLSQLRAEGLFPSLTSTVNSKKKSNAGPALLFCGISQTPSSDETITTANLPWTPNFRRTGVLTLSIDDFHQPRTAAVSADPVLLKASVFGNEREYEVIEWFQTAPLLSRLGNWCAAHNIRIEQGLQIGGGDQGDASSLVGLPFVDAASYRPVRLAARLPSFEMRHAHRPRERRIYSAPLVICPEAGFARALQKGRYSAAVVDRDLVYTDSFVGVSFAGRDRLLAEALALILNSKAVAFLLTLGGSNTGLKQPKIEKVDLEALVIPDLFHIPFAQLKRMGEIFRSLTGRPNDPALAAADEAVMEAYGLDSHDRRVLDGALARTRPILLDSREERQIEVGAVPLDLLHEYGGEVAHWLDTALRETSSARTVVSRGVRVSRNVIALRLDIEIGPVRPLGHFAMVDPDLFEARLFGDDVTGSAGWRCRSGRSLRVYADDAIYIVKPDERRQWTISAAQSDLRQILNDVASGPIGRRRVKISPRIEQNDLRRRLVLH